LSYVFYRLQKPLAIGGRAKEVCSLVLSNVDSFGDNDLDLAILKLMLERVDEAFIELGYA